MLASKDGGLGCLQRWLVRVLAGRFAGSSNFFLSGSRRGGCPGLLCQCRV